MIPGPGTWAGAPGKPEAGDGGGHEAARKGHAWETGHTGSSETPAWPSQESQPADVPKSSGKSTTCSQPLSGGLRNPTLSETPQDVEQEAERKEAKAVQLEQKMNDMEKVIMDLEQRYGRGGQDQNPVLNFSSLWTVVFFLIVHDRLQNSEQERKQSDQSDEDMKMELEGKVDALQKQLTDLDTLRSAGNKKIR